MERGYGEGRWREERGDGEGRWREVLNIWICVMRITSICNFNLGEGDLKNERF